MDQVNIITVFTICLFLFPMIMGVFRPLTASRIYRTFHVTIKAAFFFLSAAFSVYAINYMFSGNDENVFLHLFKSNPFIWNIIVSQDILAYTLFILILLLILNSVLQPLSDLLLQKLFSPLSEKAADALESMNTALKRPISSLWFLPKSLCLVLFFSFLFNLYVTLSNNKVLGSYINDSGVYRLIEEKAVNPILSSDTVKQVSDLVDGEVGKAVECLSPEGRKFFFKVYINGVKVDDAIKSNPDIDNLAVELAGGENDDYKKAEILYTWVSQNISFDYEKAELIEADSFSVSSGSLVAFQERTGNCFDKACLYVSMCRAAGIKVRLVTGESLNDKGWLNHSWNQIHCGKEDRWVNVDTTFGSAEKSYFDPINFHDDHRGDEIQGEW